MGIFKKVALFYLSTWINKSEFRIDKNGNEMMQLFNSITAIIGEEMKNLLLLSLFLLLNASLASAQIREIDIKSGTIDEQKNLAIAMNSLIENAHEFAQDNYENLIQQGKSFFAKKIFITSVRRNISETNYYTFDDRNDLEALLSEADSRTTVIVYYTDDTGNLALKHWRNCFK